MSEELFVDDWSSSITLLTEGNLDGSKPVIVEGKMQHGNVQNGNGRVYLTEYLDREVNRLQPQIKARKLYGELDHPNVPVVKYSNASHLIVEARMDGEETWGKYQILRDTPKGRIVLGILKEEGCLSTSSRALGTARPAQINNKPANVIGKDMKMITWDLVTDNSAPGCDQWQLVNESMIHYVAESMRKDTPKQQEKKLRNLVSAFLRN